MATPAIFRIMPTTLCIAVTLHFALFVLHLPIFLCHFIPMLWNVDSEG